MQPPTCVNLRVNTPAEALVICHAVYLGKLRMITRRLDTDERRAINSGNVYVWEERGSSSDASGMSSVRLSCPLLVHWESADLVLSLDWY